jgi:hypothetical protein
MGMIRRAEEVGKERKRRRRKDGYTIVLQGRIGCRDRNSKDEEEDGRRMWECGVKKDEEEERGWKKGEEGIVDGEGREGKGKEGKGREKRGRRKDGYTIELQGGIHPHIALMSGVDSYLHHTNLITRISTKAIVPGAVVKRAKIWYW